MLVSVDITLRSPIQLSEIKSDGDSLRALVICHLFSSVSMWGNKYASEISS
jgi:hypothetical protein